MIARLLLLLCLVLAPLGARAQFNAVQTWGGTSAGTANAQTVTVPNVGNMQTLLGVPLRFIAGATNTQGMTLNVNSLGAIAVVKGNGGAGLAQLFQAEVSQSSIVEVVYDGTFFQLISVAKQRPDQCSSFIDFGGNTGLSDNSAALAFAISSLSSTGGCISFPAGKFAFTAPVTISMPNAIFGLRLQGAAQDATVLYWPNAGNGMTINYIAPGNSVHISDLTFSTGAVNPGSGNGLTLNQASCLGQWAFTTIDRVTFRGDDNINFYWNYAAVGSKVSGTNWSQVLVYGTAAGLGNGILLQGSNPCFSIQHNLSQFACNSCSIGFTYGSYLQGVTISQSNFTNGDIGVQAVIGGIGGAELNISDSQFNTVGDQVQILNQLLSINFHNNLVYVANGHGGLVMTPGSSLAIGAMVVGNHFVAAPGAGSNNGVVTNGTIAMITGNIFDSLVSGIWLQSGSGSNNIQSNFYINNTCGVFVVASCVFTNSSGGNTIGGGTP